MGGPIPDRIDNVTVTCKAQVYFDGRVVVHQLLTADGDRIELWVIQPGEYRFGNDLAQRFRAIAGRFRIRRGEDASWTCCGPGDCFHVPAASSYHVQVKDGLVELIASSDERRD